MKKARVKIRKLPVPYIETLALLVLAIGAAYFP